MNKKIFAIILAIMISTSFAYAAQPPVEDSVLAESSQVVVIDHDTMVSYATAAGVEVSANSEVSQIEYLSADGISQQAIMVTTESTVNEEKIFDFVIPYSYDEDTNKMVNSLSVTPTAEGYLEGIASLPDIYINARCRVYEYIDGTEWVQYLRPTEFSAKYTLTNSSFEIYSMTGRCEILGSAYDENLNLIGHNYPWVMDFYQAHPVAGVYYSSPSSQALTSVWLSFGGSPGGDGIGFSINYSGYRNGEFVSVADGFFYPLTNS